MQDGRHAHRQSLARHRTHAPFEQRRIRAARCRPQTRPVGAGDESGRGLVESDVTVCSEAENLQVDAAGALDGAIVAAAFTFDVGRRSVEKVNAAPRDVDVIEQEPLHDGAVAAPIASREAEKFVEIESGQAGAVETSGAVQRDQLAIERHRGAAGRQAEDQ